MRKKAFVLVVVVLAVFLRIWRLDELPAGFHNDEASFLYNAILLSQTGMDEDGRRWPLYLHSFIDPKPALFAYVQIPFVWLLGESLWAARLPGAIFSLWSLWLVWRLLFELGLRKRLLALIVGVLVVSPWHILLGRGTQEVVMSMALGLLGLVWLARWARGEGWRGGLGSLFGGLVMIGLAMYSYHSAKVVMPLLVWLVLSRVWRLRSSKIWLWGAVGLIVMMAAGMVFGTSVGQTRYMAVNIFSKSNIQPIIDEQIALSTTLTHPWLIRVFHNKVVNGSVALLGNYLDHFDWQFWFFGQVEPRRYAIPYLGLLYLIELPLILVGAWWSVKCHKQYSFGGLMLGWLLVAPAAAAMTIQEVPSVVRAAWFVVPLGYFVAVGLDGLWEMWRKGVRWGKGASLIVMVGYLWGMSYGIHQWRVFQPNYHPWYRNVADMRLADELASGRWDDYERVVISRFTGQPYIYFAMKGLIPAAQLQSSYPRRLADTYQFGRFVFVGGECVVEPEEATLFVVRENCRLQSGYMALEKVTYADGNDGYSLVRYQP